MLCQPQLPQYLLVGLDIPQPLAFNFSKLRVVIRVILRIREVCFTLVFCARECLACTGDVFVFRGKPVAAVPDVADVSMKFSEFAGDEHAVTGLPLRLPRKGVLVQRQHEFVRHGTGNEGVWGGLNLLGSESN